MSKLNCVRYIALIHSTGGSTLIESLKKIAKNLDISETVNSVVVKSAFAPGSARIEECAFGDRYPIEEFEATTVLLKFLVIVAMI